VVRGSGCYNTASYCRSSFRFAYDPSIRDIAVGFRVSLPADGVKESLKRQGVAAGRAAPPSSEAPIDFAVERKAAERLLRLGKGTAWLGNHNRQWLDRGLKEPLPVEPFCIVNGVFPNADLTDDELGVLTGCRAIDHLQLTGNPKLTAAGLMKLGPLPHLLKLEIGGTSIGNETLAGLGNYPSLKELFAIPSPINEAGWASLPACPRLEQLITSFQVGDAGLRRIAEQCPELRQLTLFDWSISDLSPLARLPRLRFLQTGPHALSDAGIDTLLKLPVLDELCVDNADSADLARLPRLAPNLTRLHLRNQDSILGTNSEVWASVTQLSRLLELSIDSNIFVDGPALQRIMAMSNLRRFYVYELGQPPDWMAKFRTFTADDVATFRRQRPDVELVISGQTYPALSDWPGKFEGSTSIAEWTDLPPGAPAPAVGNFSPEVALQHQTAWAEYLKQPVELTNSTGMKFRLIPPSETVSNLGTPEQPRNSLQRIEKPYYLGATEVTVGQFQQFVAATADQTDAERLHNGHNLQFQPDPNATWKTPRLPDL